MPAPLLKELRDRFARLLREGLSGRCAREIRSVGVATVAPMGRPAGSGKLAAHVGFLLEVVEQDQDITLFELRDALAEAEGVTVHHSAIAALLKHLGFTHKKSRWWPPNGDVQR